MRLLGLFAAACLIAISGVTAAAQLAPLTGNIDFQTGMVRGQPTVDRPAGAVTRAVAWFQAILTHQPGSGDSVALRVAGWSSTDVGNLLIELETLRALFKTPERKAFPLPYEVGQGTRTAINFSQTRLKYSDDDLDALRQVVRGLKAADLTDADLVARAVVLHSDIRFQLDRPGPSLHHADGRADTYQEGVDQLKVARYLTERLRGSGRDDDILAWYRATLAVLVREQSWNALHLEQALERFGDDGDLHFLGGCLHELMAAPRSQEPLSGLDLPFGISLRVGSSREELGDAVSDLRRATQANPNHAEARLHYGRVLVLAGRPREAIPELQRAATGLRENDRQYFAQLFLGLAYENNRQQDEARKAYQSAAALVPLAQAPRLALSQLAAATGDRQMSDAEIARVLALPPTEEDRVDPWWDYFTTCGVGADDLMHAATDRLSTPRGTSR